MARVHTALVSAVLLLVAVGCRTSPSAEDDTPRTPQETTQTAETEMGTVRFQPSCADAAQSDFQRGLAQLHHMWYSRARDSFQAALDQDPNCAMAHWGVAMSYYTTLWAPPTEETFKAGAEAAERASELGGRTVRERAFIDAVTAFYEGNMEERPISPAEVIIADEHLGDILFRNDQYADAVDAYQRSLERTPNRFRAIYGVAISARRATDGGKHMDQLG